MIKILNLYKNFGKKQVLKGLNLSINDGERLVILGRSGEGKTVLLKHIVGLLKPDKGEIWVDNVRVDKLKGNKLYKFRQKIAYVFQSSALLDSLTVFENLALALENKKLSFEEMKNKIKNVLKHVELKGVENLYPEELSGGMKKRVAIARALIIEPEYILFDEPTTALDPITTKNIEDLILKLADKFKLTYIIVTHDIRSALKLAHRIVFLNNGKIEMEFTPDEIEKVKKHKLLSEFFMFANVI